jgi:ribosome-associated toxin RatA of RatAB toxin-antitoxin module
MYKNLILTMMALVILCFSLKAEAPLVMPAEAHMDYSFKGLDDATMKTLLSEGSLIIVRQNPDLTLINVTSGQLVDAPLDTVYSVLSDYDRYDKFMPQASAEKVIKTQGDDIVVTEQTIELKIWRLPSITTTSQIAHKHIPPDKQRFWHVEGPLVGTYGGWDLVEIGDQTMVFYTLYSNLTELKWGIGSIFESEPDFMAGINVTTAMMVTKAVKEECERKAKKK